MSKKKVQRPQAQSSPKNSRKASYVKIIHIQQSVVKALLEIKESATYNPKMQQTI